MSARAQDTFSLTGQVLDAQGIGVPGVQVIAFTDLNRFAALGTGGSVAFANTNSVGEYVITGLTAGQMYAVVPIYDANGNGQDDDGRFFAPNYREVRTAAGETARTVPPFVLDPRVETGSVSITFSVPSMPAFGGAMTFAPFPQAYGGLTELLDNRRLTPLGVWVVLVRIVDFTEQYYNWTTGEWFPVVGQVGPEYFKRASHLAATWAADLPALEPGSYRVITVAATNARRFTNRSSDFNVGAETTRTWKGAQAVDEEWTNGSNWEPAGMPDPTDHVIIEGGGIQPVVFLPPVRPPHRITIRNGGSLKLLGTLNVTGDVDVTLNGTAGEGLKIVGETSGGARRFGTLFAGGDVTFTSNGGNSLGNFTDGNLYVGGDFTAEGNNAFAGTDGTVGTWLIQQGTAPGSISLNPSGPDNNRLFKVAFANIGGTLLLTDLYSPRTTQADDHDFFVRRNAFLRTLRERITKLSGSLQNAGVVSPGESPGTLAVDGRYTQTDTGVLEIEVGGAPATEQFDRLTVTGTALLDGTLAVLPIQGYTPAPEESFPFMTYADVTGTFDSVVGAPAVHFGAAAAMVAPGGGGGFPLGDVNGDGDVNVSDAVLVLRFIVDQEKFTADQITRADVDKSGDVDVSDAVAILRKVVGLPTVF